MLHLSAKDARSHGHAQATSHSRCQRAPPSLLAQLWRGNAKTLAFKHERTIVNLPKLDGDKNTDFGYAWLLPLEERRALVFYYHGMGRGPCPIWVVETKL